MTVVGVQVAMVVETVVLVQKIAGMQHSVMNWS